MRGNLWCVICTDSPCCRTVRALVDYYSIKQDIMNNMDVQDELSSVEESHLVFDCILYMIVTDQKKYIIKKTDIIKTVLKEHRKQYKNIIETVKMLLNDMMGIDLLELECPKGTYLLRNKMKSKNFVDISDHEKMKLGLISVILTLIFMKEDYMLETDLWKALKRIGIDPDSTHPVFGDIKKFVTQELVKQMYLQYNKEENDPPVFTFSWGPRAKVEVSKLEILKIVCEIYGDGMTPQQWPNQYNQAIIPEEHAEVQ